MTSLNYATTLQIRTPLGFKTIQNYKSNIQEDNFNSKNSNMDLEEAFGKL
jgi:hypothetical protein